MGCGRCGWWQCESSGIVELAPFVLVSYESFSGGHVGVRSWFGCVEFGFKDVVDLGVASVFHGLYVFFGP